MSLTVKAYLFRGANSVGNLQNAEIRRFGIDEGVATNYSYLERRVAAIFPNLVDQLLRLHWLDADEDYISFSSDDELLDAISGLNDAVLKIYITSRGESTEGTDGSYGTDEQHLGVTCDGCQNEVRGARYKCLGCVNFDLCRRCENQGIHSEHTMLRLVKPLRNSMGDLANMMGVLGMGFGRAGGHGRGGFGRGGGGFGGRGGRGRCPYFPGHRGHHGHHGRHHHGHDGCPNTCGEPEGAPEGAPAGECGTEANPSEDFLTSIGEQVAAMLDPFGVNVQIDVEHENGQRHRCGSSTTTSTAATSMETDDQKTSSATATPAATEEVSDAIPIDLNDSVPTQRPVAPLATSGQQTNESGSAQSGTSSSSIGPHNVVYPPQRLPISDCGFTMLYPSIPVLRIPQTDPFERGLAPHVLVTLQQMKAMGFTNENGWLSALLSSKDGNLDTTLDSLRPSMQNYTSDRTA